MSDPVIRYIVKRPVVRGPNPVYYIEAACSSAATKPTARICAGSRIRETDTGKLWEFDEDSGEWKDITGSGGGGGAGSCALAMTDWGSTQI